MSEHVFISYSHFDAEYVGRLKQYLEAQRLDVWTDEGVPPGAQFVRTIEDRIRACGVLVVIMSPRSRDSEWVTNEILLAQYLQKPIMPLLLDGDPFWELRSTQYDDVRGARMPGATYLAGLGRLTNAGQSRDHSLDEPQTSNPELILSTSYDLRQISAREQDHLVFAASVAPGGVVQPVAFNPDEDGNLAVLGTLRSGKTTLLRTVAASAGLSIQSGLCHVYAIDFGNGGLSILEDLPHVGSVIPGTDFDRQARLITWLSEVVVERGRRYAQAAAGTITEYRAAPDASPDSRILLLIDGFAGFRLAYEAGERARLFDTFLNLCTVGRPVGVHAVVTADRPASVPAALAAATPTRVVLRMADANDYLALGVPAKVLKPSSPPGRGLLHDVEVQVAVLGDRPDMAGQQAAFRIMAEWIAGNPNGTHARQIPRIPERVELAGLPPRFNGQPVLGLHLATLEPCAFAPQGTFLIAGPPLSGRTSAMRTIATALRRWQPELKLHLISPARRSSLADLDLWTIRSVGMDLSKESTYEVLATIKRGGTHALFIENAADFSANMEADQATQDLVRACKREGVFVVGESESSALGGQIGVAGLLKASRYGLALGPDPSDGDRIFRTPFPNRLPRSEFPPGRALFVYAGRATAVGVGWVNE